MNILHRLKINNRTVTIVESENSVEVEIHGATSKEEEQCLLSYIEEEGIIDEILSGNVNFAAPLPQHDED